MWHTPEFVCSHSDAFCPTQSSLSPRHFHSGPTLLWYISSPERTPPLLGRLMLNDRQPLIKAAPGSCPVTARRGRRRDDTGGDRSSMPGLELGQRSGIRQHGWTLLAPPQTMHSPQWTSIGAKRSVLSVKCGGTEPQHAGVDQMPDSLTLLVFLPPQLVVSDG